MKITLILGSVRPLRESHKPALYIKDKLEKEGQNVTFIDLKELDLPVFNDSPEQMTSAPVQTFIQSILSADAIIAVYPEYNHNISSAMINALEFLRHREFMHKPVGLVATSNGLIGGARSLVIARGTWPTLGAVMVPSAVQIPEVQKAFLDEKTCLNPKVEKGIVQLLKEVIIYATVLQTARTHL